ncbi:MAG: 6,7-dimethyl-8-ribityllumazine synthase [Candidatus Coatesbacteria bacterium]|nr:MAG: 6,7-dimethyl-8-ribityllumazine synthase [Candidatus Coatesbacteria bacterium]HDM60003.1 6,7-dimethyl-8-ribityllumazine synthase [Bacillota bacterium]
MIEKHGIIDGKGLKISIVAARFNEFITQKLVSGARDCLVRHNVADDDIEVVWVPGALEIASVARMLADRKTHDAVICLGAVIRGATPHFDYVSSQTSRAISTVALQSSIPVVFGVITSDTIEQAIERAGTKMGNKGFDAALSALELVNLYKTLREGS